MVEKASEGMDASSEVGPVEDVIQALLNYLVEPLLPLKLNRREAPSLAQQQSVARQMHAVVFLYNYYQRTRHPEVEFVGFESFCKLAVILKPNLMGHMKLMQRSDYAELDDLENQLSMTEKAMMNACDISLVLDASKDAPNTKGWPVSKVAVVLTDSSKDNCFLQFSSLTQGVWSIIEKDIDISNVISEYMLDGKQSNKRKRNIKKPSSDEVDKNEADFRQVALSAVKEATGIIQSDLVVLDSHAVYSLSKEKATTHCYIMQCNQSINEDLQVPIKDVIESLQGPLVKKSSYCWTVTPVVEYFPVLPYAGILKDWFSREVFSNSLQDLRMKLENVDVKSSQRIDNLCNEEVAGDRDNSDKNSKAADSVDNETENKSNSTRSIIKVYRHQKRMTSADSNINAISSEIKAKEMDDPTTKSYVSELKDELPKGDRAPVPCQLSSNYIEKLHVNVASKENALSQAALRVLLGKRYNLACQLRNLEDEIAVCDRNIQAILDGDEDDLALKIEAIIDACNGVCQKGESETQEGTRQCFEHQVSPQYRRKRLSEAVLTRQNSRQELDDICHENNWMLPAYCVSPVDGGFQADVTVKGIDFKCSVGSGLRSSPRLARESAAEQMIAKLQSMARQVT